eukprot:CAMPEP_0171205872 /NCGR_PEP_ID=MMETSP0790-20130122/26773_1 /TAXON_ID=2925 /ORGANISM="Alexandrium catenella, Strain OF101" /LENGTH=202 /DNA_ID=CAMNT_0011671403 /DNA_START=62 /DNA_END=667 /DNA_ORIENTATION=-
MTRIEAVPEGEDLLEDVADNLSLEDLIHALLQNRDLLYQSRELLLYAQAQFQCFDPLFEEGDAMQLQEETLSALLPLVSRLRARLGDALPLILWPLVHGLQHSPQLLEPVLSKVLGIPDPVKSMASKRARNTCLESPVQAFIWMQRFFLLSAGAAFSVGFQTTGFSSTFASSTTKALAATVASLVKISSRPFSSTSTSFVPA